MPKLTDAQVQQKLTEGRNYKRLYGELKVRFDEVKAENQALSSLLAASQAQIEKQAIQIAELQTMVFGRQKRPPMGGTPIGTSPAPQDRGKDSYRRPLRICPKVA